MCVRIKVDGSASAYISGRTDSHDFPVKNAYQDTYGGGDWDAFLTKFAPNGESLVYSTYLGGSQRDYCSGLKIGNNGEVYMSGHTSSTDFPIKNAYQDTYGGGDGDAFIAKLSSDGADLLFSTYFGGSDHDRSININIDKRSSVYITGETSSQDFPVKNAYQDTYGGGKADAIFAKFKQNCKQLVFSTFLGGSGEADSRMERSDDVIFGNNGSIYLVGITPSDDFPIKNAYQGSYGGGDGDAFIIKFLIQKDDIIGTWDGQGVYYRNSDDGTWVKMASPADQIADGDLDGDGVDDLIGIWPGQGGVWVKYSSTGTWSKLSSSASDIASGDMNGDGTDDLLGTWDGQGVYYRDSDTGSWVKMASPADLIAAGDLDRDGIDDLTGIWAGQGGVWVKYSSTGSWSKLSSTAKDIASGDMNGDGTDDLLGTWDGQGVYYRDSDTGSWVKMASPADLIAAGDLDGDGKDDLLGIWASQGGVWVKYSYTGTWAKLSSTASDIDAGKMSGGAGSAGLERVMNLPAPVGGGYAEGPGNLIEYKDLGSEGPGGQNFVFQVEENLFPKRNN